MKFGAMVATAALIAGAAGSASAEWVMLKEAGGQSYYVDTASRLEAAPGVFRAWAKTVFKNNPAVSEKQTYEEYDCKAGTVKTISVVVTVRSGALVTETPEKVETVAPGSPAHAKQWYLCESNK